MKICVAGWYFEPMFYMALSMVRDKYESFIVAHKPIPDYFIRYWGLKGLEIPNIGLEFGCYDWYLKVRWDGKSNVLFTHDDTLVRDVEVFDEIAKIPHDCAYIFRDYAEEMANGGKHGRAIFMSARFLKFTKNYECNCHQAKGFIDEHHHKGQWLEGTGKHKGFWYDPQNRGHVAGKPPLGVRHYNESIYHFHEYLGKIRDGKCGNSPMDAVNRVYFPNYECGRRGEWKHKDREIKKYGDKK